MRKRDRPGKREIRFTSSQRKAQALRRLGISADQIANVPQITAFLRNKRCSLKPALQAMLFSQDQVVKSFLAKRNSLGSWARENVSIEAIALAAGIDVEHLLGATLLALRELGKFEATMAYPDVIKKRIEFAMLPGGWRDREFIHKLVGFPPIYA